MAGEMLPGLKKYPHIFSPIKIGRVECKNRIKYASTETNFNYRDGYVADKEVGYMEAQARGGAGWVTTQGAYTDPIGAGKGYVGMMAIWDDKFIPGLARLNKAIKKYDTVSCLQLMDCGRVGGIELPYTIGPSNVPQKLPIFRPPKEMTLEDIERTIQNNAEGARRSVEAGFDIIEISGIVGYLLSNFISSYTNKRTDEYGGDIKGRCKFVTDIIKACKKASGGAPVGIRLCGEELLDDRGGNTPEESLESIKLAVEAGADYISVTAGWQESMQPVITRDIPMGHWLYIAERMKKNINVPVSMAYRLFVPSIPEKAMAEGRLDVWEMCRPMIADPSLPKKIMEGREQDIIPCIACNVCLARLFRDTELCCTVRPSLGHENEEEWGNYGFAKDKEKKKIIVVGAGIAGLQAAAIAAEKGNDVTVYEKRDVVGGQFEYASHGPWGDDELMRFANFAKAQCDRFGAKIVMNKAMTTEDLKNEQADIIIIATGAVPDMAAYAGTDKKNVVSALDVLAGKAKVGKNVVILGGKGAAISTALYIIDKDKTANVSIVGPQKKFGPDVNPSYIWRYMLKLKAGKVNQVVQSKVKEIVDDGVVVIKVDKSEEKIAADTVVIADLTPNKDVKMGKYGHANVFMIGDAIQVRRGYGAIHDGYRMGMKVTYSPYKLMHREKH
ncbi:MAG TPA: FAD-dependent oxidoreductase [Thermodesulfobacteriota bacterium]|nr:FAD-dependent oxidoreductase [Thermodesulfobacteriota bacterium]